MNISETLKKMDIPCVYSHFQKKKKDQIVPPYIVYIGSGQRNLDADNTHYWRENTYQLEYYFIDKDEEKETEIEDILLEDGFLYEKSEDIFLEEEGVFLIYYYL